MQFLMCDSVNSFNKVNPFYHRSFYGIRLIFPLSWIVRLFTIVQFRTKEENACIG
jgi:hypothetical protein